jgi:hypothetical protein
MAANDAEKLLIARALKTAGLIAVVALEKAADCQDLHLSATTDSDIPAQTKHLK